MNLRRLVHAVGIVLLLAGCAQETLVPTGQVVVGQRMVVDLDRGWNQLGLLGVYRIPTWTREGNVIDTLVFYVGLRNGDLVAPALSEPQNPPALAFRAGMQSGEVVGLFERLYSRGGSTFTLDKVSPETFVGAPGYRFEFSSIRKSDNVRLRGVGWFAQREGELFAITYTAPRLAFFPAGIGSAESIARSARIKG